MKHLTHQGLFVSFMKRIIRSADTINTRIFFVTFFYFCLMFFCTSNLTLFLLSLVYFFSLWKITKNIVWAAFLSFLVNIPFVKGKSVSLFLIPGEMIQMNVKRDLFFYFPITLSDFYLALTLWMGVRFHTNQPRTLPYGVLISLGLFVLVSAISAAYSENLVVSMLSSLLILKLFIVFLLPTLINSNKYLLKIGLYVMAAFTLFESAWSLSQFFLGGHLGRYIESFNTMYSYGKVAWENTNLLRVSGTFVDPDILGTFMFMHCILFFYLWLTHDHKFGFERKLYAVCAIFSGISIMITGNRILYVLLFISVLLLIVGMNKGMYVVGLLKKPVSIIIILFIMIFLFPYIATRLQNLPAVFSDVGSGTFRVQMAQYSLRLGFNNLFGVGLGMSPYHFASNFSGENMIFGPDYPHNIFSQIFAETGIVGLIAFFTFLYVAFRSFLMKGLTVSHSHYYLAALAFVVSACFYPLFIPLVELTSFFFLYMGIATFSRL